ncbi:MAG TPA: DMT family transporter [Firmicutes bacterium]|nr:DMT family transporter [Bacillota bacterium]
MQLKDKQKGYLYAAAGAVGWGFSGVCSQYLFGHYGLEAGWLTAVRMLLSGAALLLIAAPRGAGQLTGVFRRRQDVFWLLAFALLGLLLCQYTYLLAIQYSNSATATVLQSLNVVMMAAVMALWRRTGLRRAQVLALILALAGTFLIATHGHVREMTLSGAALAFGLLSAAGVVSYTLLSRPIVARWGNTAVTGWGMLIGGAVLGAAQRVWRLPAGLDAAAWLLVALIVLVGTAGGFSLFLQGVKYIGPEKATLIGCLEPATATVLSAVWLHTAFGAVELAGFVMIVLTVFLAARPEGAPRPSDAARQGEGT